MFKKRDKKIMAKGIERENANQQLTRSLSENIETFKSIFKNDNTVVFREVENMHLNSFKACLIYIDGMINEDISNRDMIFPMMNADLELQEDECDVLDKLKNKVISASKIKKAGNIDGLLLDLFSGDTLLLVDGFDSALTVYSQGWETRALAEPDFEKIIRGPREGFTESIMVNLSLIRRKLKTQDLKFKFKEIGTRTRTKVCICYIDTLANCEILKELESRLDKIDIDGVLDSGYIQELITDSPLSPFKTIGDTERPDVVAAKLLEGRIAVVVDGTPAVLTLPHVFMEHFQSAEDYYTNYYFASINRIIRVIGLFFTTSIPAIYVALIAFHQEMIPSPLLLSISAARQGVPFPTIVEAIMLLFAFEVIREAGKRTPSTMGQSVSIVGALILGQAAVEAKIVSAPMVIVVATTGVTGILIPELNEVSIILRLILLMLAAFMGLYGYIFGIIGLLIYLFSMRSFGVPYMLEYGSINPVDLKDTFIRAPWWYMAERPKRIASKINIKRKVFKPKGK